MEYYHVFTKGLSRDVLFSGEQEFVFGMNMIPKSLIKSGVKLLAFCLMDNHVHFVVEGSREECNNFIISYKRNLCSYLSKSGKRCTQERIIAGISKPRSIESLLSTIAYVLKNPVAAGCGYIPQDYRWSSAALYFRESGHCVQTHEAAAGSHNAYAIGSYTCRERFHILKSRISMPADWLIDSNGMILPECYTEIKETEQLFSSVRRYLFYMSAGKDTESSDKWMIRLSDTDLRKEAAKICMEEFGTISMNLLDMDQRIRIGKRLRKDFGSTLKQTARIIHLDARLLRQVGL